jgi:hypothetical protein
MFAALTITLGWWSLPAAITLIAFAWLIFSEAPRHHGDYDLGPMFEVLLAVFVVVIAWLLYFMAAFFFHIR